METKLQGTGPVPPSGVRGTPLGRGVGKTGVLGPGPALPCAVFRRLGGGTDRGERRKTRYFPLICPGDSRPGQLGGGPFLGSPVPQQPQPHQRRPFFRLG